jgi:hypothetical protein
MRDILDELVAKGVRAEIILRITKLIGDAETLAARREHDRQRRKRYVTLANVINKIPNEINEAVTLANVTAKKPSLTLKKEVIEEAIKRRKGSSTEIEALGEKWPHDFRVQFWAAYPKKVEKPYALKCLDKVRRSNVVDFATVLAGVARIDRSNPKYIKNPSTWLNRGCWTDGEEASAPKLTDDEIRAKVQREIAEEIAEYEKTQKTGIRKGANGSASRTDNTPELRFAGGASHGENGQGGEIGSLISAVAASACRR